MFCNRFVHRNHCCCNRCRNRSDVSAQVYTLYSMQHFVDVPMHIYYGSGYSHQQVLESIDQSLSTLAESAAELQSTMHNHGCGCC